MITLKLGDCIEVMKSIDDNSIDSIVTDPPAGISFMGKEWDDDKGGRDGWIFWMREAMEECLRVLKPGGHALVWSLPRTSHWTATALENAGFEIRDCVTHLFGTGFPKSLNVAKAGAGPAWEGFGTALKPAAEFWWLCRKPLSEKTVVANVLKWGTGALNIDACRIPCASKSWTGSVGRVSDTEANYGNGEGMYADRPRTPDVNAGSRFPANLILDEEAAKALDEQSGQSKGGTRGPQVKPMWGLEDTGKGQTKAPVDYPDSGGASRFFYVAKASKADKNTGCERVFTWEGQDQNLQALVDDCVQLARATSDDTALLTAVQSWSTDSFGKPLTDPFRKSLTFTTSTVTKLITELRTSNCSLNSRTKESILAAIRTIEESGLSLAESAEYFSRSSLVTTNVETELVPSARTALVSKLQQIRALAKTGNVHSTVKSTALMSYLIKLVTPPGGVVLDPFMGSGSTGVAAIREGCSFFGIEQSEEYFNISKKRIGEIDE